MMRISAGGWSAKYRNWAGALVAIGTGWTAFIGSTQGAAAVEPADLPRLLIVVQNDSARLRAARASKAALEHSGLVHSVVVVLAKTPTPALADRVTHVWTYGSPQRPHPDESCQSSRHLLALAQQLAPAIESQPVCSPSDLWSAAGRLGAEVTDGAWASLPRRQLKLDDEGKVKAEFQLPLPAGVNLTPSTVSPPGLALNVVAEADRLWVELAATGDDVSEQDVDLYLNCGISGDPGATWPCNLRAASVSKWSRPGEAFVWPWVLGGMVMALAAGTAVLVRRRPHPVEAGEFARVPGSVGTGHAVRPVMHASTARLGAGGAVLPGSFAAGSHLAAATGGPGPWTGDEAPEAPEAPDAQAMSGPTALQVVAASAPPHERSQGSRWRALAPEAVVVEDAGAAPITDGQQTELAPWRPVGERGRSWTLPTDSGLIALASYLEQRLGKGEDAEPSILATPDETRMLLAVYDGLGGAGSAAAVRTADGTTYSGAFVASRLVREVVEAWYREDGHMVVDEDDLAHRIEGRLRAVHRDHLASVKSSVTSSLTRALPTTMAGISLRQSAKHSWALEVLWAGDSRGYLLTPESGLQQLGRDHVRRPDVFSQLLNDSPMKNVISASDDFYIERASYAVTVPFVAVCATDGVFGYVATPGQTEYEILHAIGRSGSAEEWAARLAARFAEYSSDDASIAVCAVGWKSFDRLRGAFKSRYRAVRDHQVEALGDIGALDHAEGLELRRRAWDVYRADYLRLLADQAEPAGSAR